MVHPAAEAAGPTRAKLGTVLAPPLTAKIMQTRAQNTPTHITSGDTRRIGRWTKQNPRQLQTAVIIASPSQCPRLGVSLGKTILTRPTKSFPTQTMQLKLLRRSLGNLTKSFTRNSDKMQPSKPRGARRRTRAIMIVTVSPNTSKQLELDTAQHTRRASQVRQASRKICGLRIETTRQSPLCGRVRRSVAKIWLTNCSGEYEARQFWSGTLRQA